MSKEKAPEGARVFHMTIDYAQRRIWHDHRTDIGLQEGSVDLSLHPVFSRMTEPACVVALLPADPLAPVLDFDGDAHSVLPPGFDGRSSRLRDAVFQEAMTTGSHALRVTRDPAGGFRSLVGLARHGGAVAGVGEAATYDHHGTRVLRLTALTGTVRLALYAQVEVHRISEAKHLAAGPFELTVALPDAAGSLLGSYAARWTDLDEGLDSPPVCGDAHALVRLEIAEVPKDRKDVAPLLTQVMGRVVNMFGTDLPLYAPQNAVNAGVTSDY